MVRHGAGAEETKMHRSPHVNSHEAPMTTHVCVAHTQRGGEDIAHETKRRQRRERERRKGKEKVEEEDDGAEVRNVCAAAAVIYRCTSVV